MKNSFLSLWLSAANRAAGPARAFLTAEMHRQQKAIMREAGRSLSAERASPPKKRVAPKRCKKAAR